MVHITSLQAREVLDSRGNPTVAVEIVLDGKSQAEAMVPSGASTGVHEAVELRDNDPKRYLGKGVLTAVGNANGEIAQAIVGKDFVGQRELDALLCSLDGTPNKGRLGANAILGVSMAFAQAMAKRDGVPLYQYFAALASAGDAVGNAGAAGASDFSLPVPMMNVINGGQHADSGLDIQEFMIMPIGFSTFAERLRVGSEIFHTLKKELKKRGLSVGVGDEGGFAPHLDTNEAALELLVSAIGAAGYTTDQVKIALDCAASSFYKDGAYICHVAGTGDSVGATQKALSSEELVAWYGDLIAQFPIVSIEDPCAEDDWHGFSLMMKRYGSQITIVGDDLLVTNVARIRDAAAQKAVNAVLIKMNQIGTISETIDAIQLTQQLGWKPVVSHRSGETEDTTLADLCVGLGCPMIKTGSLCRSERIAKYNRLLKIEGDVAST